MAALGREFGRTMERMLDGAPLPRRIRLGIGGTISAVGLVTLAAQAAQVVTGIAA